MTFLDQLSLPHATTLFVHYISAYYEANELEILLKGLRQHRSYQAIGQELNLNRLTDDDRACLQALMGRFQALGSTQDGVLFLALAGLELELEDRERIPARDVAFHPDIDEDLREFFTYAKVNNNLFHKQMDTINLLYALKTRRNDPNISFCYSVYKSVLTPEQKTLFEKEPRFKTIWAFIKLMDQMTADLLAEVRRIWLRLEAAIASGDYSRAADINAFRQLYFRLPVNLQLEFAEADGLKEFAQFFEFEFQAQLPIELQLELDRIMYAHQEADSDNRHEKQMYDLFFKIASHGTERQAKAFARKFSGDFSCWVEVIYAEPGALRLDLIEIMTRCVTQFTEGEITKADLLKKICRNTEIDLSPDQVIRLIRGIPEARGIRVPYERLNDDNAPIPFSLNGRRRKQTEFFITEFDPHLRTTQSTPSADDDDDPAFALPKRRRRTVSSNSRPVQNEEPQALAARSENVVQAASNNPVAQAPVPPNQRTLIDLTLDDDEDENLQSKKKVISLISDDEDSCFTPH